MREIKAVATESPKKLARINPAVPKIAEPITFPAEMRHRKVSSLAKRYVKARPLKASIKIKIKEISIIGKFRVYPRPLAVNFLLQN
jgi:hypothetical protein